MSRLLPSASPRPLVTSGIAAGSPPVPVERLTPGPSRLNHVSMVNAAAPRPGAGPNVTRLLTPSRRRPLFDPPAEVTDTSSLALN